MYEAAGDFMVVFSARGVEESPRLREKSRLTWPSAPHAAKKNLQFAARL